MLSGYQRSIVTGHPKLSHSRMEPWQCFKRVNPWSGSFPIFLAACPMKSEDRSTLYLEKITRTLRGQDRRNSVCASKIKTESTRRCCFPATSGPGFGAVFKTTKPIKQLFTLKIGRASCRERG